MKISEVVEKLEEIKSDVRDVDVMADHFYITDIRLFRDWDDDMGNPIGDVVNIFI